MLPNNQTWTFEYNDTDGTEFDNQPVNYGTLTQVTLPTGGTISYTYTNNVGNAASCQNGGRFVASRTVNDQSGGGNQTWTYTYNNPYSGGSTVVTDPLGNDVVHTFGYSVGTCSYYETQTQYYQGSHSGGTLLKTVNTSYSGSQYSRNSPNTGINVVPIQVSTVWPNGQTATVTKQYDNGFSYLDYMGFVNGENNAPNVGVYGKVMGETHYDYSGAILQTTNTSYQAFVNSNYLNNNMLNLVYSTSVLDGDGVQRALTTYGYDESSLAQSGITEQHVPPPNSSRGNQTSVHHWLSKSSSLTTTKQFWNTGMVYEVNDPAQNQTTYNYSSSYWGAYITSITNAAGQVSTYAYDLNSGLLTNSTDVNQQPTNYTYDVMSRPTGVTYPDSGQMTFTYNDSTAPYGVTADRLVSTGVYYERTAVVDGLGRVIHTTASDPETVNGASGPDTVDITYDGDGRKASQSNAHRSSASPTDGITSYVYDALGRKCVEIPPDGTPASSCPSTQPSGDIFTTYSGNATSVYDEAGHGRKNVTDGMGRLTQVFEAPYSLNYETDYSYDALNDLTAVTQKGSNASNARSRSFSYDWISRLTSSTNPETGAIQYYYLTSTGGLCSGDPSEICWKSAPQENQQGSATTTTVYTYDMLNRVTSKSYNDGTGQDVFVYDVSPQWGAIVANPVGRLVLAKTNNANIGNVFSYDVMGRVKTVYNVVWSGGNVYSNVFNYAYNLDGSVASIKYPSGSLLTYGLESGGSCNGGACTSGRVSSVVDTVNNINYMNGQTQAVTYAPTGQLLSMTNGYCPGCGTTGFNGYTVVNSYNTRLQPYNLSANSTASPSETILSLTYNFLLGLDNGNVAGITNWLDNTPQHPGVGSVTYGYDALNRITSAQTTGSDCTTLPGGLTKNWGESYTVDAWGNMTTATVTQCSAVPLSVNVNTSNQFANACYDAAGNLLNGSACGQLVYTYNGKNQLVTTGGYTYSYDAEGDRVIKANGSTGTIYARSFGSASMYETDLSGNFQNEYIFLNGRRIARRDASGNQHYYFSDMLGSSSVTGNQTGQIENVEDFYPYGLSRQLITNVPQPYQFTGKERDAESGFDDFGARYYSSYWSRFMTPDWAEKPTAVPYANYGNPQSLNLYSYVENNPTTLGDPDGHEDQGSSVPGGDAYNSAAGQAQYASMTGGDVFEAMNNYSNYMAMTANAQAAAQNTGEGSQANLDRRQGIADAAVDTKQRADLGQKQYGPNQCSAMVAGCIAKAGAKAEFDDSGRPPVAGEWANKKANIPGWRVLGPDEKPAPGDVAAVHIQNPHFAATGDSAIVVKRGTGLSAIQAGDHGVEYNSNFIHGYEGVVYRRYTGD